MRNYSNFLLGLMLAVLILLFHAERQPAIAYTASATLQVPSIAALRGDTYGVKYIQVNSYYDGVPGGGGLYIRGKSGCVDNGGTIIRDTGLNCFYLTGGDPSNLQTWGAKCDATAIVNDGSIAAGSAVFTSSSVSFSSTDIGKIFMMHPASARSWRTSIVANSGGNATLAFTAPNAYPGSQNAKKVKLTPIILNGPDSPGTGVVPGDTLTAQGGVIQSSATTATVVSTGLESINITTGGSGYLVNDTLSITATTPGVTTQRPAVFVVTSAPAGVITAVSLVDPGSYKAVATNPSAFTVKGGHGTGFTFSVAPSDGSFGASKVSLLASGVYTSVPSGPVSFSDSGHGNGVTAELVFDVPVWMFGTDDTAAITAAEAWAETAVSRGVYANVKVPSGHVCLTHHLAISRPVSWGSSGTKQGALELIFGSPEVDNSFVTVASSWPSNDNIRSLDLSQNQEPSFTNLQLISFTNQTAVDVDGTTNISSSTDCVHVKNPITGASQQADIYFADVGIFGCPGNGLNISNWIGEIKAQNIHVEGHGGDCVRLSSVLGQSRFYSLRAMQCGGDGVDLINSANAEFHGVMISDNAIGLATSGIVPDPTSYLMVNGGVIQNSTNENAYLDEKNVEAFFSGFVKFSGGNISGGSGGITNADVGIDGDVANSSGLSQYAAVFDNTIFSSEFADKNVFFGTVNGSVCSCVAEVGGATRNVYSGAPTTNNSALLLGPQWVAPPKSAVYAVATLPTCNTANQGSTAIVTNALSPTFLSTVAGAGAVTSEVVCNGTNWVND